MPDSTANSTRPLRVIGRRLLGGKPNVSSTGHSDETSAHLNHRRDHRQSYSTEGRLGRGDPTNQPTRFKEKTWPHAVAAMELGSAPCATGAGSRVRCLARTASHAARRAQAVALAAKGPGMFDVPPGVRRVRSISRSPSFLICVGVDHGVL
jgi:hypothetical protein